MSIKKNKILVIIKSSAGEIEWILPFLITKKEDLEIIIIFETRAAYLSLKSNKELYYLWKKYFLDSTILLFEESMLYRIINFFIKFKILSTSRYTITIEKLIDYLNINFHVSLSLKSLSKKIKPEDPLTIFKDYNGHSILSKFLKRKYKNSKLIFFPHSNHIFSSNNLNNSVNKKIDETLIVSNKEDVKIFSKSLNVNKVEIVGYPFLSQDWINEIENLTENLENNKKRKILLISRSSHKLFFSDKTKSKALEILLETCCSYRDVTLYIKAHPREKITNKTLEGYKKKYPGLDVILTNSHLIGISSKVDLIVSFWSSGILQSLIYDKPVIELYPPKDIGEDTAFDSEGKITTVYNKLGLAINTFSRKEFYSLMVLALEDSNNKIWKEQKNAFKKHVDNGEYSPEKIFNLLNK